MKRKKKKDDETPSSGTGQRQATPADNFDLLLDDATDVVNRYIELGVYIDKLPEEISLRLSSVLKKAECYKLFSTPMVKLQLNTDPIASIPDIKNYYDEVLTKKESEKIMAGYIRAYLMNLANAYGMVARIYENAGWTLFTTSGGPEIMGGGIGEIDRYVVFEAAKNDGGSGASCAGMPDGH